MVLVRVVTLGVALGAHVRHHLAVVESKEMQRWEEAMGEGDGYYFLLLLAAPYILLTAYLLTTVLLTTFLLTTLCSPSPGTEASERIIRRCVNCPFGSLSFM